MEVWFRWFSFSFRGENLRFQPLVFRGIGIPMVFLQGGRFKPLQQDDLKAVFYDFLCVLCFFLEV